MEEKLLFAGGIYHIALIVFHASFWRIFNWPITINSLDKTNKSTNQVLNISITFIFFIFAYISIFHADELINTPLGKTILIFLSALWSFRAAQQIYFYKLKHKASIFLTFFFIVGGIIYGIPATT